MNIKFKKINRLMDGINVATNSFTCPLCKENITIYPAKHCYATHGPMPSKCEVEHFLLFSDIHWKIHNPDEYNERIIKFWSTDEYTTVIKQELLKNL